MVTAIIKVLSFCYNPKDLDCIGVLSFYNSNNMNFIGELRVLQLKEHLLYWGAVFFKICSHVFTILKNCSSDFGHAETESGVKN